MAPPSIVQCLQAGFLASVQANLLTTPTLSDEGRRAVSCLMEEGAPVRLIADATSLALMEGFVDRLNRLESGRHASLTSHGPERLFEPLPGQGPRGTTRLFNRDSFLKEIEGHPFSMRRVLEIRYPFSLFAIVAAWLHTSTQFIHGILSEYGLYFYHAEAGIITVRVPTLTLFEAGLRHCFGDRAARLCETDGRISEDDINELHAAGYHPHGLPFRPLPIHMLSDQDPALFGPHDNVHAAIWSSRVQPWQRTAATLLYHSMKEVLQAEEQTLIQDIRERVLDLNVMDENLQEILRSFRGLLPPLRMLQVLENFLGRMNEGFSDRDQTTGLLRLKRSLRAHIGQLRRLVSTQFPAI